MSKDKSTNAKEGHYQCGGETLEPSETCPSYTIKELIIKTRFLGIPIRTDINCSCHYPSEIWWIPNLFIALFNYMGVVAKELASCEVIVVDVCRKGKEGDWSGFGWVTSSKKRASLVIYINKKSFDNLVIETKEERFNSYGYDLVNMVWHEICHFKLD